MTDPQEPSESAASMAHVQDAEELIRAIGLVFSNTFLYGPHHGVTRKAVEGCFIRLEGVLKACGEVSFQLSDDDVQVNGESVELKNPLARMFVTHLNELGVNNLSIVDGLSREKFEQLMEIMNAKPEELQQLGGFAAFVASVGIEQVRIRKMSMQKVEEHERVVSKDEVGTTGKAPDAAKSVETIMAFLRGEVGPDAAAVQSSLQEVPDAKKLGELILKAAEIRQTAQTAGGENFADIVVGCLRRVHEGMSKSPAARTQKGKKTLSKSLMLLEKEVLDKMREMAGEVKPADEAAVHEVVEELTDDLAVDGLASEYMKRRTAIESSEKRILRFIKKKGMESIEDTDLRDRLVEGGLTPDGWQELLVKSREGGKGGGAGSGDGPGGGGGSVGAAGGLAALGNIAMLLAQLEKRVAEAKDNGKPAAVNDLVEDVGKQVQQSTQVTEAKIEALGKDIRLDQNTVDRIEQEAATAGTGLHMPRRQLFKTLSEIGQEICQPLSVVNCSLDMLKSQNMGAMAPEQKSLLDLAMQSADRLRVLVEDLKEICGMPDTMTPDAQVMSELYKDKR